MEGELATKVDEADKTTLDAAIKETIAWMVS